MKAKKLILLTLLGVLVLSMFACVGREGEGTSATPELVHYANSEFGYSIDYPKGWLFEQLNPNEIGVKPRDSEYNQVQIAAYFGEPMIGSVPESWVAASIEASLQQFFDLLGGRDLNVFFNEPASGKWDWVAGFTVIYEDTPLQGQMLVTETESVTYVLMLVQFMDWPEGQDVVDSFRIER